MPYLIFLISAAIVVVAANRLAEYGDVIAVRTGLGGLFVGAILLAGATSLPELIASISAFAVNQPDLAAGNFFGSNMINMFLLAVVDLINYQVPLLRRTAITHTLTAALAIALMAVAVIFIIAEVDTTIGWVGVDSLILIGLYFGGLLMIRQEGQLVNPGPRQVVQIAPGFPSLRRGVTGFIVSAAILAAMVPFLVNSSNDIAAASGLGASFVGTTLLSLVTSLPELLAAYAAVRIGAVELAVGNLFGSSVFNMLALGVSDFFYTKGRFLGAISSEFELVGLLGLLLTVMALIGNVARVERRIWFVELDALAIVLVYLAGMYLIFLQNGA